MEHGLLIPCYDNILGRQHHPGKALVCGRGSVKGVSRQGGEPPPCPPSLLCLPSFAPTTGSPAMLKVKFWLLQAWPKALWAQQE